MINFKNEIETKKHIFDLISQNELCDAVLYKTYQAIAEFIEENTELMAKERVDKIIDSFVEADKARFNNSPRIKGREYLYVQRFDRPNREYLYEELDEKPGD